MEDFNFTLKRLETWHGMVVTIADATNTPIDLTNATIEFNMKRASACSHDDYAFQATVLNGGIIITDGVGGKFMVEKTEFDLIPASYLAQVKIINEGETIFPLTGTITIEPSL